MKLRSTLLLLAPPISACAVWALFPLRTPAPVTIDRATTFQRPEPALASSIAFTEAAFQVPLWVAPLPPPAQISKPIAVQLPPAPPPFKLQLVAILRRQSSTANDAPLACYSAVLYDPDSDRLFVLSEGEDDAGRTAEAISEDRVQIRYARGTAANSHDGGGGTLRTLTLRDDESSAIAAPGTKGGSR